MELPLLRSKFENALVLAVDNSDYGLDCKIQRFILQPDRQDASFPAVEIRVGYARLGTNKHVRLMNSQCPDVVGLDISLNEAILITDQMPVDGVSVKTYGITDLIAEKYRALLQQKIRNRCRRQDVYDLERLIQEDMPFTARSSILAALLEKSQGRGISPNPDSLGDPEIKRRAEADYQTLADEIDGLLPDFEKSYSKITSFYKDLPW